MSRLNQPILVLDVGNTNTVVGVLKDPSVLPTAKAHGFAPIWRISTHPLLTSDELKSKLKWFLRDEDLSLGDFGAVVVSSVVPAMTEILRFAFGDHPFAEYDKAHPALIILNHESPFSFRIDTASPSQVGTDRLVNAEAAVHLYGAPCIIIDSGTATTVCAVAGDSKAASYRGGAIMPGLELSLESLARRAAQLFSVELSAPESVIGDTTTNAIRSGLMHGYASMIDGMVEKFKVELGSTPTLAQNHSTSNAAANATQPVANTNQYRVIGTGGISQRLRPLTKSIDTFDADLTLKGMAFLYESLCKR